jgi:hypothetical protein
VNRTARSAASAALLLLVVASPAFAQGRGRGLGKNPAAPAPVTIPGTGIRQFGVWLDDATVSPAGQGWATFSVGYTRAPFGNQWDAPSVDAGIGMAQRFQIAISAPMSRVDYNDGTTTRSVGDVYGAVKIALFDPTAKGRSFGLAVVPVVEFLSPDSVQEGAGRVFWALPVAVEKRFEKFRTYGTVGYFSRGSAFAAGAFEMPLNEKITVTATLSHARSVKDDALSDALDLAPSRWDASGGAVYFFNPRATFFASLGRTLSRIDANASSLSVSAGVSFGFQHRIGGGS